MATYAIGSGKRPRREILAHVDLLLVASTVMMAVIGVVMVYSATRSKLALAGLDPRYDLKRQAVYALMGMVVMGVVMLLDYHRFEELGVLGFGAVFVGLLAVLTPFGSSALGSQRWFQLGSFQLQPSAFASLLLIPFVATYCRRAREGLDARKIALLLVLTGVPILLVARQPDLGTAIIMGIILIAMLVAAGVRGRYLTALFLIAVVGVVAMVHFGVLKHYQVQRLTGFLNQSNPSAPGTYNLTQSKIAIGGGSMFGHGLFHDPQTNLSYVPEQQTDFIFTAVGGQLGFVGAASVLGLFGLMCQRIWRAARSAKDDFGMLLCVGALALIGFSVFQNAGMTMGIMPITGIPLPFMSYGGSSTIAFFAAIGIVLNVGMRRYR
ncbi:MAG: FtsW/RodA/SpoVE family cell cycle protein [Acidimicrobiales bacterium]